MIKPSMFFWLKICSTQLISLGWQRCGESRVPSFSEVALLQASKCCQEAAVPQEPFAQPGGSGLVSGDRLQRSPPPLFGERKISFNTAHSLSQLPR